jgi:hypothetical protein
MTDPRRSRSLGSHNLEDVQGLTPGSSAPRNQAFEQADVPHYLAVQPGPAEPPAASVERPRVQPFTPERLDTSQMPPPGPFAPVRLEFQPTVSRSASRGRRRTPAQSPPASSSPSPSGSTNHSPYAHMTTDARFLAALGYLDGIGGVGALLLRILNHQFQPAFQAQSFMFWRSKQLPAILSTCWDDVFGREQLVQWMRPKAEDLALAEVSKQMEAVKRACLKNAKDFTIDELMNFRVETVIVPIMERNGPLVIRFLNAAVETERGLVNHKKKTSFVVSMVSHPLYDNTRLHDHR